jgi:hypothetical protein
MKPRHAPNIILESIIQGGCTNIPCDERPDLKPLKRLRLLARARLRFGRRSRVCEWASLPFTIDPLNAALSNSKVAAPIKIPGPVLRRSIAPGRHQRLTHMQCLRKAFFIVKSRKELSNPTIPDSSADKY